MNTEKALGIYQEGVWGGCRHQGDSEQAEKRAWEVGEHQCGNSIMPMRGAAPDWQRAESGALEPRK